MARASSYHYRRGAVYAYRRRVPDDVRHDPVFGGRPDYRESLCTSDPTKAKRRALERTIWFDREVARVRGFHLAPQVTLHPGEYVLSHADLADIQARYWKQFADEDFEDRLRAQADPGGLTEQFLDDRDSLAHMAIASFNNPTNGERNRERFIRETIQPGIEPFVTMECRRRGIETGSRDYQAIRTALVEAELETLRTRFERQGGEWFVEPNNKMIANAVARGADRTPESSWTILTLAKHCNQRQPKSAGWQDKVVKVATLFERYLGQPKAISAITGRDIEGFVEVMLLSPDRLTMRFPGKSPQDAVMLNRQQQPRPHPTLKPNTVKDTYLAVLIWLFRYARRTLRAITVDPTEGVKVPGASKRRGTRPAFRTDELNAFFRLPVFEGCKSAEYPGTPGGVKLNDHRFWVPLIMLFSGARPSELAQLAVTDAKLDHQFPHINILTEFDEDDADDRPFVVAFKTPNARRDVPIHPELLRLGFDRYVKRIEATGEARLFPNWALSPDKRKLYSQATWIRNINGKYIPKITNRKPKPTLYSLRHTCKTRMVACGVQAQIQNQLLGHAKEGMDAYYFAGVDLDVLSRELHKLQYEGLSIDHLIRT